MSKLNLIAAAVAQSMIENEKQQQHRKKGRSRRCGVTTRCRRALAGVLVVLLSALFIMNSRLVNSIKFTLNKLF